MLVKKAKKLAKEWVMEKGIKINGFDGAFFHGSIVYKPDDAEIAKSSDVDLMLVLNQTEPPTKIGKFIYKDLLLEVSYISRSELKSAEHVLGQYHLAGSFRKPGIILDPSNWLTKLQKEVSSNFAHRKWVTRRCQHARDKVLKGLQINCNDSFPDQVNSWLFPAGVTTHILLVAGLKNPTVRRRYVEVNKLLSKYDQLNIYPSLLELLGCQQMSRKEVERHLESMTTAFDTAKSINPPFFFASDISEVARSIAIDGSNKLIEQGYHREAIFWLVATYTRCQKIFAYYKSTHEKTIDNEKMLNEGYHQLLSSLGITSFRDLQERNKKTEKLLPQIWEVAENILEANPDIVD